MVLVHQKQEKKAQRLDISRKIGRLSFPRLAAIFLKVPISPSEAEKLARYNLVILGLQAQTESPSAIKKIRSLNPDVILLAYVDPIAFPKERLNQLEPKGKGLWHKLGRELRKGNFLKTSDGRYIYPWPGTPMLNLFSQTPGGQPLWKYLGNFYKGDILSSGLWDGLFFDTTWPNISWIDSRIDYDGDGRADPPQLVDEKWNLGLRKLFENLRKTAGPQYLFIGNDQGRFFTWLNGRMFEDFPSPFNGSWQGSMKEYLNLTQNAYPPALNIINSSTRNSGKIDQKVAYFGLCSTLLSDGFFNYDWGSNRRDSLWWFPYYNLKLGKPLGVAEKYIFGKKKWIKPDDWRPGVYRRRFEKGQVLVNSGGRKINVPSGDKNIVLNPLEGKIIAR